MIKAPAPRLVLVASHLPTALGTFPSGFDAILHAADFLTIHRAGLADFGADRAEMMRKLRATELKIGRCLANLGAVHQQAKVFGFNVLSAGLQAVVHGGLQTDLMTMATSFDTGLHGVFRGGVD